MAQKRKHKVSPILIFGILFVALFAFSANSFADTESDTNKENAASEAYNKGIEFNKAGDKMGALASFKLCIKEDPNYADAYFQIGTMSYADKNYDDALSNFKIATEKDPKNLEAFTNLGKVQAKLKRYAEAEQSLKSALAISDDAQTHKELGNIYYKKKTYNDAITSYNKCHELGGGDHVTYYKLGKAYKTGGKKVEAIKALKKSVSIKGDYYHSLSTLGQIYANDNNQAKAAASYKKAMNTKYKKRYNAAFNYAIAIETSDPENYAANIDNWKNFVKMAKGKTSAKDQVASAKAHIKELEDAAESAKLQ